MDSAHIRIRETRRRHGGPTETLNGAAMAITGPRRWLTAVTAALALTGRAAIGDGQPFDVRVTGPGPASATGDPSGEPAHPAFPIPADRALPPDCQQQLQAALNRQVRLAGPAVHGAPRRSPRPG